MSDERTGRLTSFINEATREKVWPNVRPRDAATLILIDRSGPVPTVLMGKRHASHKFMPGKFVFPGGRLETDDRRMPSGGGLDPAAEQALRARVPRPAVGRGRALALAAIRETYEETGLLLGSRTGSMPAGPAGGAWSAFFAAGILPDLSAIQFVGRAITPPRRPKRFDTRFFSADRRAITDEQEGFVGPDKELVELVWVRVDEARRLDLPPITVVMLEELEQRAAAGFSPELPVPFYYEHRGRFVREELPAAAKP